jgi:hypothetical protein
MLPFSTYLGTVLTLDLMEAAESYKGGPKIIISAYSLEKWSIMIGK